MTRNRSPVDIQRDGETLNVDVAPDTLTLDRGGTYSGLFDGLGPPMARGARMALRNSWGTQLIVVTNKLAEQCRNLIGTALTIRRDNNGSYTAKPRRDRAQCSKVHPRQIIVDTHEQLEEIDEALRESAEPLLARDRRRRVHTDPGATAATAIARRALRRRR